MSSVKESKFLTLFPAKHNGCAGMGFVDTARGPVQWYVLKHLDMCWSPSLSGKKIYRWDLRMYLSKYIQAVPDRVGSWAHPELTNCEATDSHSSGRNTQARRTEGGVTSWHFIAIKKLGFGCASWLYFQPIQHKMPCLLCKLPSLPPARTHQSHLKPKYSLSPKTFWDLNVSQGLQWNVGLNYVWQKQIN